MADDASAKLAKVWLAETIEIPAGLLATLSFVSEILGEYDTYMAGKITWSGVGQPMGSHFAAIFWSGKTITVEIADGVDPIKGGGNAVYMLLGYCRYQGIRHRLSGAHLPAIA